MALFLESDDLNAKLIKLIREADKFLYLVSPYIQFHPRVKDALEVQKSRKDLRIVVVYGKNPEDYSKSMNDEQFDFLRGFPYISICYSERLHAKIYCSEDAALITSLNLYDYSHSRNVEAGVLLKSATGNYSRPDFGLSLDDEAYRDAVDFLEQHVIALSKEQSSSASPRPAMPDTALQNGGTTDLKSISAPTGAATSNFIYYPTAAATASNKTQQGFCIHTGKPIPFNPEKPLSYPAYKRWAEYKDPDYPEKFCHRTGKPSEGRTCVRKPILELGQ